MHFPLNIVFKRDLNDNYKVRQLVFRKYDSLFYYKVRQVLLQSSTVLLQNVTGITVKVWQVLRSVTGVTKCDDYTKRQMSTQQMVHTVITRHAVFPNRLPWKICVFIDWFMDAAINPSYNIFWVTPVAAAIIWIIQYSLHHTVSPYNFPWKVCAFIHSWAGRCNLATSFRIEKPMVTPLSLETHRWKL